jgi:PiT family inorganic phosphate transporter
MGVFVPAFNLDDLDLGLFILSSNQQLFLMGGLAIALGIFTYSRKVMETIGGNIIELTSEGALVVVLAESLVLFIFSSSALSDLFVRIGLPAIPMVPVSSSQVVVGCVMGIGIYKGLRNINFRLLGGIAAGWIATPLLSGALSFFSLFFVKNIFNIEVVHIITGNESQSEIPVSSGAGMSEIVKYLLLGIMAAGFLTMIYFYLLERKKRREIRQSDARFWKNLK